MNKINLKKFPLSPGVYLFKNAKNVVIYIGRAGVLRKRVASYFSKNASQRTKQMANEAKRVDFKKTHTLLDAVILEANLIKKYEPKYNIREKDNRSFVYIVIPKTDWAYPLAIREQQLNKFTPDKAHIFGPFQSQTVAGNLLNLLRKIVPYSTCQKTNKPCFHFQIRLCPGKCVGNVSQKEYQKHIKNLILLLKGEKEKAAQNFKKTAPDKVRLLKYIDDSILLTRFEQKTTKLRRIEGYDISHFGGKETVGAMAVWQKGSLDKSQYRLFKIRQTEPGDDLGALAEVVSRRLKHIEWPYPNLILVDGGITQIRAIEKVLSMNKISIPVVGIVKPRTVSQSKSSIENKYQKDRLIFGKMKRPLRDLISLSMPQLQQLRNEAHRFANFLRKKMLKRKMSK